MKLADIDFRRLLPPSIAKDGQLDAAARAITPHLAKAILAAPNLLIYARLGEADPARFLAPLRRFTEARPGLAPLNMEMLESLAWQFHVDFREAARNEQELAGMVRDSIAWHRIKGTKASIYAALKLCGFSGITIEEHDPGMPWACYQLGFAEIASDDDLARIVAVCREMQPARCRLWRVYVDEYDMRPGVWSGPLPRNAWSYAWWSRYSGQYFPDIPGLDDKGLMVSFGVKRKYQTEPWLTNEYLARIWMEQIHCATAHPLTHYIWSKSRWSDVYPVRHGAFMAQILATHSADFIAPWPDGSWPEYPWATGVWDIYRQPWAMDAQKIYKSQGVYSDNSSKRPSAWSALNCNWSVPIYTEGGETIRWSMARWSDKRREPRIIVIPEQFLDRDFIQTEAIAPRIADNEAVLQTLAVFSIARRNHPVWSESDYSQAFPRQHGFFGQYDHVGLIAERLYTQDYWPHESWEHEPWGEFLGYGRKTRPWKIFPQEIFRSQGVWSDTSSKRSTWSGFNCNWSGAFTIKGGKSPRWSSSTWSGKVDPILRVPVLEQLQARNIFSAPPLLADSNRGQSVMASHMATSAADLPPDAVRQCREETFVSVVRQPDTIDGPWTSNTSPWPMRSWPEKPWQAQDNQWQAGSWQAAPWSAEADPWPTSHWQSRRWDPAATPWRNSRWGIYLPWEIYRSDSWEHEAWEHERWRQLWNFERPQQPFGARVETVTQGDE